LLFPVSALQIELALKQMGSLDVLVLNAGRMPATRNPDSCIMLQQLGQVALITPAPPAFSPLTGEQTYLESIADITDEQLERTFR
jgi:NAD(P)-dependent dehydrogenase (short-subunit alcohol dehydrogenase family)